VKPQRQPLKQAKNKDSWLIVGLGNPGSEYQSNRHNVGQMTVDAIAKRHSLTFKSHKSRALVAQLTLPNGDSVLLAKSMGFMNVSGEPVALLAKFYSIETERIIVIHDELDLDFGDIRKKFDGGHAGHNGLRDVSAKCGTNYHRVRIGIGRPPGQMPVASFVLQNFSTVEKKEVPVLLEIAADKALEIIQEDI